MVVDCEQAFAEEAENAFLVGVVVEVEDLNPRHSVISLSSMVGVQVVPLVEEVTEVLIISA